MAALPGAEDDVFEISLDALKIREIEEIEEYLGCGIDAAFLPGAPKAKGMRAIAWVMRRRDDPDFTIEQAGELVVKWPETEPDPTDASAS